MVGVATKRDKPQLDDSANGAPTTDSGRTVVPDLPSLLKAMEASLLDQQNFQE